MIQETLEEVLKYLATPFRRIRIDQRDKDTYRINIESDEPSLLIGHHGENIGALEHILKNIIWKKSDGACNIVLDIDDYRKRQEENVIHLAERKAEMVQRNNVKQALPAMSSYFRRIVHLHLTEKFPNIQTESEGEGDFRHITIKLKTAGVN